MLIIFNKINHANILFSHKIKYYYILQKVYISVTEEDVSYKR